MSTRNTICNGMAASRLTGARWQKSGRSQGASNCVEFAELGGGQVAVRNSRHPEGPVLVYSSTEIAALLDDAKDGELDHLIS